MHSQNRLQNLDGLRGIAILAVVVFHYYIRWWEILPYGNKFAFYYVRSLGLYGVFLFFMISGYVIFLTLDRSKSFGDFIWRRWSRLFPAMLFISLFIYLTANLFSERPAGIPHSADLIPGLLFVEPAWLEKVLMQPVSSIEGAFWSLYVEVRFYLLFGALYFSLGRTRAVYGLLAISALSFIYTLGAQWRFWPSGPLYKSLELALNFPYQHWFLIGIVCYQYKSGMRVFNSQMLTRVMLILGVLAPFILYHRREIYMAIPVVALFLAATFDMRFDAFFKNRLLLFFGLISYPLYLVHENIGVAIILKASHLLPALPDVLLPLIPIAALSLLSYAILRLFEQPVRAFLAR